MGLFIFKTAQRIYKNRSHILKEIYGDNPVEAPEQPMGMDSQVAMPTQETPVEKKTEQNFGIKTPIGNITYSQDDLANSMIDVFEGIEGSSAHVGQDKTNLTLAYGIVADKVMYNGKMVTPDKFTEGDNFDPSKVDMSTAVKDGIRRADFNSDKEWTNAVMNNFIEKKAKDYVDTSKPIGYNKFVMSTIWNTGSDKALTWSGFSATLSELGKPHQDRDYSILAQAAKHAYTGGQLSAGLAARRLRDVNMALPKGMGFKKVVQEPSGQFKNGIELRKITVYDYKNQPVYSFTSSGGDALNSDGEHII